MINVGMDRIGRHRVWWSRPSWMVVTHQTRDGLPMFVARHKSGHYMVRVCLEWHRPA